MTDHGSLHLDSKHQSIVKVPSWSGKFLHRDFLDDLLDEDDDTLVERNYENEYGDQASSCAFSLPSSGVSSVSSVDFSEFFDKNGSVIKRDNAGLSIKLIPVQQRKITDGKGISKDVKEEVEQSSIDLAKKAEEEKIKEELEEVKRQLFGDKENDFLDNEEEAEEDFNAVEDEIEEEEVDLEQFRKHYKRVGFHKILEYDTEDSSGDDSSALDELSGGRIGESFDSQVSIDTVKEYRMRSQPHLRKKYLKPS